MTTRSIYDLATVVVIWGAYVRVACVLLASVRTVLNRRRFVTFKVGGAELAAIPEPFLLAAAAYLLHVHQPPPETIAFFEAAAAVVGAVLLIVAWDLTIWAFLSWPGVFAGHGIVENHRIVSAGAYGFVRHPIYLGVFLFWIGLALAFTSATTFLIAALYVVPSYLLYMRSEEQMMMKAFGDEYRGYQRAVPFLVPRLGRRQRPATSAAPG